MEIVESGENNGQEQSYQDILLGAEGEDDGG